ncbi:MAG: amidohydrolase [Clostridia bacterium]|nr:amidohydrolase [Clostridia bacterium]
MKTLFQNCKILVRQQAQFQILENACLGVNGDTICYIGEKPPREAYELTRDYSGKLLIPGLYNCHTHSPMVLFRGAGNDKPLEEWLTQYIFPLESRLTSEAVKTASEFAIMEMLAGGIVSFTDMYFFPEMTARAVAESGIKANLTKHIQFTAQNPEVIQSSLAFVRDYNGAADGRILADFGIHSCYTCEKDAAAQYTALCNEAGGRLHIHLSETEKEYHDCMAQYGVSPAAWFADIGALHARTAAAHCVVLSESDRALLAQNKVNVVHCPTSNLKLGSGFAPVPELLEEGVNVALGTDGAASNNNLNLFEEMHLAAILHNGRLKDSTIMNTQSVMQMATAGAAKAQGRENCGELKVGYKADIAALDLDKPHLLSGYDERSLLTYSAQSSDVCMTMVDGKILYENGEYLSIDKEKVCRDMRRLLQK